MINVDLKTQAAIVLSCSRPLGGAAQLGERRLHRGETLITIYTFRREVGGCDNES